jgi:hypothetical protein
MRTDITETYLNELSRNGRRVTVYICINFEAGPEYYAGSAITIGSYTADASLISLSDLTYGANSNSALHGLGVIAASCSVTIANTTVNGIASKLTTADLSGVQVDIYQKLDDIDETELVDSLYIKGDIEYNWKEETVTIPLVSVEQVSTAMFRCDDGGDIYLGEAVTASAYLTDMNYIMYLVGYHDATTTTLNISVENPLLAGFSGQGEVIVDFERILYTGVGSYSLTGCVRGSDAASHSSGAMVCRYDHDYVYDYGPQAFDIGATPPDEQNNDLFFLSNMYGGGNSIQSANQGEPFTSCSNGITQPIFGITAMSSKNIFAASVYSPGASTFGVYTSTDGLNWTARDVGFAPQHWTTVASGMCNGREIIVGRSDFSVGLYLFWSDDGVVFSGWYCSPYNILHGNLRYFPETGMWGVCGQNAAWYTPTYTIQPDPTVPWNAWANWVVGTNVGHYVTDIAYLDGHYYMMMSNRTIFRTTNDAAEYNNGLLVYPTGFKPEFWMELSQLEGDPSSLWLISDGTYLYYMIIEEGVLCRCTSDQSVTRYSLDGLVQGAVLSYDACVYNNYIYIMLQGTCEHVLVFDTLSGSHWTEGTDAATGWACVCHRGGYGITSERTSVIDVLVNGSRYEHQFAAPITRTGMTILSPHSPLWTSSDGATKTYYTDASVEYLSTSGVPKYGDVVKALYVQMGTKNSLNYSAIDNLSSEVERMGYTVNPKIESGTQCYELLDKLSEQCRCRVSSSSGNTVINMLGLDIDSVATFSDNNILRDIACVVRQNTDGRAGYATVSSGIGAVKVFNGGDSDNGVSIDRGMMLSGVFLAGDAIFSADSVISETGDGYSNVFKCLESSHAGCYGNGYYVVVSDSSTRMYYKKHGDNYWGTVVEPDIPAGCISIDYGNGIFVSASSSNASCCRKFNTPDGAISTVTEITGTYCSAVFFDGEYFNVLSTAGTHRLARSTDGDTWAEYTMPGDIMWYDVCKNNTAGKYLAVGANIDGDGCSAISDDGYTYSLSGSLISGRYLYKCEYFPAGKCFVGVTVAGGVYTSIDGEVWTERRNPLAGTVPPGNPVVCGYGESGALVIPMSKDSGKLLYTLDGINYKTCVVPESADIGVVISTDVAAVRLASWLAKRVEYQRPEIRFSTGISAMPLELGDIITIDSSVVLSMSAEVVSITRQFGEFNSYQITAAKLNT